MSEGEEGRLSEKEGWAWKENKGKSMGSLKMDGLRLTGCNSKQLWPTWQALNVLSEAGRDTAIARPVDASASKTGKGGTAHRPNSRAHSQ